MSVTEAEYRRLALEDPSGHWELYCGQLRQKPEMTVEHNYVMSRLWAHLRQQLDDQDFDVRSNAGHVRRSSENYFIPDVYVIPMELIRPLRHRSDVLEAYAVPLPLVVEIWSPSTGNYDVDTKIPEYQRRGDLEIWRIQPYEHTLKAWRREPDGSYTETLFRSGVVHPVALPGVGIDLDLLLD